MQSRTLTDLGAEVCGCLPAPSCSALERTGHQIRKLRCQRVGGCARPANGCQDALGRKGIANAAHRHTPDAMHDLVTTTTWLKSLCGTPEGDPQTVGMRLTQFREDPAHKPPDDVLALPPAAARRAPHPAKHRLNRDA